jgi:hypothetical protein
VLTPGGTAQTQAQLAAAATAPAGLSPADLQDAYGLQSSSAGMLQTAAVVTAYDDPTAETDMGTYRSEFGISPCTTADGCFSKVTETGGITNYPATGGAGWDLATAESLDMISAVCPNCHIVLVEATTTAITDLGTAENEAVALGAKFVTNTWFTPEATFNTSEPTYDADYFDHPGVAITAPDGNGAGYGTYYPAASPDVIAVGGTTLTQDTSVSRGWTEATWSGTGSGCSPYEAKPSWQTDTGCSTRMLNDVSAVADPSGSPVAFYDTTNGGWVEAGGNAAAAAIIAAAYALAGTPAAGSNPASYPYAHPDLINNITTGSDGTCSPSPAYFCTAGTGYNGPTGLGTPASVIPFTSSGSSPAGHIAVPGSSGAFGMCLDDSGSGTTNGNPVEGSTCGSTADSFNWQVDANGTIEINGKCLDVYHSGTAVGTLIDLWTCNGTGAQQWRPRSPDLLENPQSGMCVDDPVGNESGTQAELFVCVPDDTVEQWTLPYSTPTATGEVTSGISGDCLDNYHSATTDDNKIDIYPCDAGPDSQEWTVEADGTVQIPGGHCLDVYHSGSTNNSPVDLYGCNGSGSQQWLQQSDGTLLNPESGLCLDAPGTASLTQLVIYTCDTDASEVWVEP